MASPGTLTDIAQTLNLSIGTVSRALRGRGEIAEATRQQVARVAAQMNYTPRRIDRREIAAINRVGVCVGNPCLTPDGLRDPSYVGFHHLIALERAASAAKVGVQIGFIDAMAPGQRIDHLPVLQRGQTQGVVLVYPFPESVVKKVADQMPVVSIEHVYPSASLDTVGPAHSMDVMSAVEYLYKLGHRRIAYVCDEEARGHKLTLGLRHAGYVSGLTRCELAYRPDDVVNIFPPVITKPQLAAWVAGRVKDGVTAVITSIDRHGYLLWNELPKLGIDVPGQVSIVGIGGVSREKGQPQLTTWRCDYESIAATVLDALRVRYEGRRTKDLYQEIASVFVRGESSAPCP